MTNRREGWPMPSEPGPSVLLGNLGPIMRLGMNRVLSEEGCNVVGQEDRPSAIVGAAHRLGAQSPPRLWAPGEGATGGPAPPGGLGPGGGDRRGAGEPVWNASRLAAAPTVERLRRELSGHHVHE